MPARDASSSEATTHCVLRLDHIFNAFPMPHANISVLRVSTSDFEQIVACTPSDQRRPTFMQAPVECAAELPVGVGVIGFSTGHVREVRIEWSEITAKEEPR